jgi:CheY-like chemotaxis protein
MTHILIVDDDPVICLILERMLRMRDYQVVSASDGENALKRLAEKAFDLIITDLSMPNMDGLTMLQHLRSNAQFTNLPVIVLTAASQTRYQQQATQLGVFAFLTKPFNSVHLKQIVKHALQKTPPGAREYAI